MPSTARCPSWTRSSRPTPVLTPALYALARRAADRAAGSATDILRLVDPQAHGARREGVAGRRSRRRRPTSTTTRAPGRMPCSRAYPGARGVPRPARTRRARRAARAGPAARTAAPPARGRCCWPPRRCARSRQDAARSSWSPITATRRSSRPRWPAARPPMPSSATTRGRPRRRGTPHSCACSRPCRASSSAIAPRSTRRCTHPGSSRSGTTAIRCSPSRSAPACTRATPRSSGRSSTGARWSSPATPARPTSSASSRLGLGARGVRRAPCIARASCSARRKEGESRGARVPSAAFAAAREALKTRTRARAGRPARVRPGARVRRLPHAGPLRALRRSAARRAARRGARVRLVRPAGHRLGVPATARSARVRMASSGSERTADELGRAFPGIRIIVADGEHPVTAGRRPPGARRRDPRRRADRRRADTAPSSCSTAIGCCWPTTCASASPACGGGRTRPRSAAPGAPVHLVGVTGAVARALATWTQPAYARAELADRAPLRMPPTVRVAALEGDRARRRRRARARCVKRCPRSTTRRSSARSTAMREPAALVRFDYAHGRARRREPARLDRRRCAARAQTPRRPGAEPRAPPRPRLAGARNTLRVRVDVPDLDL